MTLLQFYDGMPNRFQRLYMMSLTTIVNLKVAKKSNFSQDYPFLTIIASCINFLMACILEYASPPPSIISSTSVNAFFLALLHPVHGQTQLFFWLFWFGSIRPWLSINYIILNAPPVNIIIVKVI